jgi:nucleoside-diphosphate-sugar epimerase
MTSALVTGGAGFIGSHIVQALLKDSQKVRILDNFSSGNMNNVSGFQGDLEIIEGDIRNIDTVHNAVQNMDVIFHEAAFVSGPRSILEPRDCFSVNIIGTENVLEEARKAKVRRVVLASSAAVYGDTVSFPLSEDAVLLPLSPYAASKSINEIYTRLYTHTFGLQVVALRYFNVYGPRQSPGSMYAAAIPGFIQRLLDGQTITIFGDGTQTRDLIFIEDVVRANLLAAKIPNAAGMVFNICTGNETSVNLLVKTLRLLFPGSFDPEFADPREGDIYRSVGNPNRSKETLGFESKTSLSQGLIHTIEWMRA